MSVAVDEPGGEPCASAIVLRLGPPSERKIAPRADPCDAAVTNRERAIADRAVAFRGSCVLAHGRKVHVDPQRIPVRVDVHVNNRCNVARYFVALCSERECAPSRTRHCPPTITSRIGALMGPKIALSSRSSPRR